MGTFYFLCLLGSVVLLAGILIVLVVRLHRYRKAYAKFSYSKLHAGTTKTFQASFSVYLKAEGKYDATIWSIKPSAHNNIVGGWYLGWMQQSWNRMIDELRAITTFINNNSFGSTDGVSLLRQIESDSSFMYQWDKVEEAHDIDWSLKKRLISLILLHPIQLLNKDLHRSLKEHPIVKFDENVRIVDVWAKKVLKGSDLSYLRGRVFKHLQEFLESKREIIARHLVNEMNRILNENPRPLKDVRIAHNLEIFMQGTLLSYPYFKNEKQIVRLMYDKHLAEMFKKQPYLEERMKILDKIEDLTIKNDLMKTFKQNV